MTPETTTPAPAPSPWIPSSASFGSRLAMVRHRMGWNVKEAARECGVPAATWRLWEVDGAAPRNLVTISMAIASRTGVDPRWLIGGDALIQSGQPTYEYFEQSRMVATVGDGLTASRPHGRRGGSRPVRQTRPTSRIDDARLSSSVA